MKSLKVIVLVLTLTFVLTGCNGKPAEVPTQPENPTPEAETKPTVISAQTLPVSVAGYAEITSYVGDVDADGTDERVVISTGAERTKNGEFLWNDGQDWAVFVEDTNGVYILLDKFVQAGSVYFDVSDYYMNDGAQPKILITETTGAGLVLKTYTYSETENGYVEETIYDTGAVTEAGINRRFTSFPEITD
ncbi:MAG: hypothetical protein E7401_03705 [Ruminococcaceae bacterium]|nr:hypothetical protein [Oscillospiraceae bacterium]